MIKKRDRKRIKAVEMNCLTNICGLWRVNRVSNAEIRRFAKPVNVGQ